MDLVIKGLHKSFGTNTVLEDINLNIRGILSLVLIGPSGGGKTTLLRILAGLEKPDSGEVTVNGKKIDYEKKKLREYRKRIGMVFQAYNLFPHLTAIENITLPLEKVHGYSVSAAREEAMLLLERFQLAEHAHKKPAALSGGQQQRTAICRAAAIKPQFLLLDEPTSALDPEYTSEVLDLIEELREEGMQLILVTHEMGFARFAAEQVLFVSDGGIPAMGSAKEIFTESKNPRVRRFLDKVLKYG